MGAFFIRLPELDLRPMHGDEANQAHKTGILIEEGTYIYDPHDHHGPTLYYLARIAASLSGQDSYAQTNETTYRIVPVIFGTLLILVTLLLYPALSPLTLLYSALIVAVSPAFIFYSRYYIQETLLVFFTLTTIGFGYRYLRNPRLSTAIGLGASLSLMHATKETAIIAYIAMAAGLVATGWIYRESRLISDFKKKTSRNHLIAGLAIALAINILLFTAFFSNLRGPLDSILTYGNYLKRADGAGLHDKPWHYYLHLLFYTNKGPQYWFSEGFVAGLGLIGIALNIWLARRKKVSPLTLFLSVYTLAMIIIYALIPYKTPWSMLSFYHGLALVAAITCANLTASIKPLPMKATAVIIILAAIIHLSYQGHIVNRVIPADPRNPYVYAHTSTAFMKMPQRVDDIRAVHPNPEEMRVYIIQPDADYWPLPFYLRKHPNVGFFSTVPENPDADIIIAAPSTRTVLAERLKDTYFTETGGLRPSVLRHVYIRQDLWDAYMVDRQ